MSDIHIDARTVATASRPLGARLGDLADRLLGGHPIGPPADARVYGYAARGRALLAGWQATDGADDIWSGDGVGEAHGFAWLDDLAAEGSAPARALARRWTWDWIAQCDRAPPPAAVLNAPQRMARWLAHADLLQERATRGERATLRRSLARQAARLARDAAGAADGPAAVEARAVLLLAALQLDASRRRVHAAAKALGEGVAATVSADGSIPSRNPEELAALLALLVDARDALGRAGRPVSCAIGTAIAAIAPVLRGLRLGHGGLARFHGGGAGVPGRLDQALARAGVRPGLPADRAMGYARLGAGRVALILDAAAPPAGAAAVTGHASTLAFELSSGRRPLIVSCGPGAGFAADWRRAARTTLCHSTLEIAGHASSRVAGGPGGPGGSGAEPLVAGVTDVRMEWRRNDRASGIVAGHDGYVATHGLTHIRHLYLDHEGRALTGEDMLATVEREDEALFDRALDRSGWRGIVFRVRFHLHPDIAARLADDGTGVALALPNGERWEFRPEPGAAMTLEPSAYLDGRAVDAPIPARQIVLAGRAADYATRLRWSLAKSSDTPDAVRETAFGDGPVVA